MVAENQEKRIFRINYHMSKDEIKYEINKVLDLLPDKTLQDLLSFLKNIEARPVNDSFADSAALKRILIEDKVLLQKLAQ